MKTQTKSTKYKNETHKLSKFLLSLVMRSWVESCSRRIRRIVSRWIWLTRLRRIWWSSTGVLWRIGKIVIPRWRIVVVSWLSGRDGGGVTGVSIVVVSSVRVGGGVRVVSCVLDTGECDSSSLIMIVRLEHFTHFILRSLAHTTTTTDADQDYSSEDTKDHTDGWTSSRGWRSVSLGLSKLPAEGINITTESFFDLILGGLVRVNGGQETVGKGCVGWGGDGGILWLGWIINLDLCLIGSCFFKFVKSLVHSLKHNRGWFRFIGNLWTIHVKIQLTFSRPRIELSILLIQKN